MDSNFTRRRFLETSAAMLGVAIVGCGPQEAQAPRTSANSDGSIILSGVTELSPGSALAFNFPSGEPGLFYVSKDGKKGAISAKCTHSGCTVEWNEPLNPKVPLRCPCHESEFALDGQVLSGPAKAPLTNYAVIGSGNSLILRRL